MRTAIAFALAAGVAMVPLAVSSAQAGEDFPNRPLTMIIGFNPGGSTDIQGRVLANVMEEHFGQPVNVINRPGAGSAVAVSELSRNTDQGYTFLFGSITAVGFTPIVSDVDYDIDDFRYVASLATAQQAIVTSPQQPFSTWEELVAHAKETPITYAQQTPLDQAIIERVAEEEGFADLAIVPTGGGAGMAPLILAQEVEFAYSGGTHAQFTPTDEMIILAFLGRERSPFYPDVPTLQELGYDYAMEDSRTIMVPADTPDSVVAKLEEAARFATEHPDFIETTQDNTLFPVVIIPHEQLEEDVRRIRANNEALLGDAVN
jgi:tripartite-type tricarboxylate transporter receptor subunit TctC